jgi:hypothetical protein
LERPEAARRVNEMGAQYEFGCVKGASGTERIAVDFATRGIEAI